MALTVGAFDGVHLGHQALLRRLVEEAHGAGLQAVAVTFDPLPRRFLKRGDSSLLTDIEERIALLTSLGLDGVAVITFDERIRAMSAEAFVRALLTRWSLVQLWVGPDFALGYNREGDIAHLRELGRRLGFTLHLFDTVITWQGAPVRSSRIRRALREGNLDEANGCLGRPYRLSGTVIHGEQRGRTLGFPTANLELPPERLLPANGVYVCRAHLERGSFGAVTNVGVRPTFDHHTPLVEAHLLDFSADIYGETLQLDFLHRLRAERRFPSVDALVAQIQRDKAAACVWLNHH